jgi:hypothetical protein
MVNALTFFRRLSTMKKFLILYTSSTPARDEMAKASPEQAKSGMDAWKNWARQAGNAIVDLGAPLADVGSTHSKVTGFTILQANSANEIEQLLSNHPHKKMPGTAIEIHEFLAMPDGSTAERVARELETSRR